MSKYISNTCFLCAPLESNTYDQSPNHFTFANTNFYGKTYDSSDPDDKVLNSHKTQITFKSVSHKDFSGVVPFSKAAYVTSGGADAFWVIGNKFANYLEPNSNVFDSSFTVSFWFDTASNRGTYSYENEVFKYIFCSEHCYLRIGYDYILSLTTHKHFSSTSPTRVNIITKVPVNKWHHIAVCYDLSTNTQYVYYDLSLISAITIDKTTIGYKVNAGSGVFPHISYYDYSLNNNNVITAYTTWSGYIRNIQYNIGYARWKGVSSIPRSEALSSSPINYSGYVGTKKYIPVYSGFKVDMKLESNTVDTNNIVNKTNFLDFSSYMPLKQADTSSYKDSVYGISGIYKNAVSNYSFLSKNFYNVFNNNFIIKFSLAVSEDFGYKIKNKYIKLCLFSFLSISKSGVSTDSTPCIGLLCISNSYDGKTVEIYNTNSSKVTLNSNTWYNIICYFNKSDNSNYMYIDGELRFIVPLTYDAQSTINTKINNSDYVFSINNSSINPNIDEYNIYRQDQDLSKLCDIIFNNSIKQDTNYFNEIYIRNLLIETSPSKSYTSDRLFYNDLQTLFYDNIDTNISNTLTPIVKNLPFESDIKDNDGVTWTAKYYSPVIKKISEIPKTYNDNIFPYDTAAYFQAGSGIYLNKQYNLLNHDFSFSAWVNPIYDSNTNSAQNYRTIFRLSPNVPNSTSVPYTSDGKMIAPYLEITYWFYSMTVDSDPLIEFSFSSGFYDSISSSKYSGLSSAYFTTYDLLYKENYWYHIALCYKASTNTFYFYINGKLVNGNSNSAVPYDSPSGNFYISVGYGTPGSSYRNNDFYGYMRDVKFNLYSTLYDVSNEKLPSIYENFIIKNFKSNIEFMQDTVDTENIVKWFGISDDQTTLETEKNSLTILTFNEEKFKPVSYARYSWSGLAESDLIKLFDKDFTFSCWAAYPRNKTEGAYLLNISTAYNICWYGNTGLRSGPIQDITIYYKTGKGMVFSYDILSEKNHNKSTRTISRNVFEIVYPTDIIETKWCHVAITYIKNKNTFYFYFNGILVGSRAIDIDLGSYDGYYIFVGGLYSYTNGNNQWTGYLREICIDSTQAKYTGFSIPEIAATIDNFKSNLSLREDITDTENMINWTEKFNELVKTNTANIPTFNVTKHKPVDYSMLFSGTNSGLYVNNKIGLFNRDFTFSCWAKYNGKNTGIKYLLHICTANPAEETISGLDYFIGINYDSQNKLSFVACTILDKTATGYTKKNSILENDIVTDAELLESRWCHIALTYIVETNTFYFYFNGKLIGTETPSIVIAQESEWYIHIGNFYKDNSVHDWNGYIRDIEIDATTAKWTDNIIPEIYALSDLIYDFKANLPFVEDAADTFNNTWTFKNSLEIEDVSTIKTFSVLKHGYFDKALRLDGSTGLYTSEKPLEMFLQDFTFSCWVNADDITSKYLMIITSILPTESVSNTIIPVMDLYYNNKIIRFRQYTLTGRTPTSCTGLEIKFEIGASPYLNTKFIHIAIVYTVATNTFSLYINGKLEDSVVSKINLISYVYYIWLGMFNITESTYGWKGYIRNVEIDTTTAKYTSDTIPGLYYEADVDLNYNGNLRKIVSANKISIFNIVERLAISYDVTNTGIRNICRNCNFINNIKRRVCKLYDFMFNVKRRKSRTQIFQINDTKRLLAKYLEFKFNIAKNVERTRKAIGIYIKSLQ